MTARDFCYWLQGLFELGKPPQLDAAQTDLVKRHLALVFIHEIDPSTEKGSADMKKLLDEMHKASAAQEKAPHSHGPGCPGAPVFRC